MKIASFDPAKYVAYFSRRGFVRDVFTLQVGGVFAHGLGFLKSIAFARMLGLQGFGLYAVASSMTGTFKIFTGFGQEQALVTYLAEEHAAGNKDGMRGVIKYFCIVSTLAALVLLAFAFASPMIAAALYDENAAEIGSAARIAFAAFVLSVPHPLVISLLQVVRKVKLMTFLENFSQVLQLVFSLAFLAAGYGAVGVFAGLLVGNVFMSIAYGWCFLRIRREHDLPGIRESVFSSVPIRTYVTQGLWIAVDKNIINFFPQAVLFLLSLYASAAQVGVAQLAFKISNLPSGLLFSHAVRMANSALPALKDQGKASLRKQCALLIKHTFALHATLVFGGMAVFPFFVILAYGLEFGGVIEPMLWILLVRLLQPFNVANTSLLRIFRKVHVSTLWNASRVPIEIGLFFACLNWVFPGDAITAFVAAIWFHQIGAFSINWYVYRHLLGFGDRERA